MKSKMLILAALAVCVIVSCEKDEKVKSAQVLSPIDPDTDIYGVVTDSNGNFLQGIVVSDGYSVTVTDENGIYQLKSCEYSYQVYVSIPAEYEVPMEDGLPTFWQQLNDNQKRYDFTLTPLSGGKEKEFNLFCIADPQCMNSDNVDRFKNETCPDLANEAATYSTPCYGVVLGDIGWNTTTTNYNKTVLPLMKNAMKEQYTGLPLFMCMGNHDNSVIINSTYSVEMDIEAQRNFEYQFGPINYSFDRGDAHIVVMDDVYFTNQGTYKLGFRDDQVEWLKQDLSYMEDGKLIILCVHIAIRSQTGSSYVNVKNVVDNLHNHCSYFHIMSGHHHCQEYTKNSNYHEHNHGAACGAWWEATICADGTPNGYAVYKVEGNEITNWYYKGTGCDRDFQIRLYHASDVFIKGYSPNYQFKYNGENQIVANIWNGDDTWKVQVYEDGAYIGDMVNFSDREAWAQGYFLGVLGKSTGSDFNVSSRTHYWYYTLKNSASTVEVVATDGFGNVYRQSTFTSNTDVDFPVAP